MKISLKIFLPIIVIIHTVIWYIAFYLSSPHIYDFLNFISNKQGEYYATLLMVLIVFNLLLACRFRFLEKIFSGLDKMYVAHKYSAYLIFILIILHNILIHGSHRKYLGFFVFSKEIANPLMWAFFISIFISALPHIPFIKKFKDIINILPYDIWKYTHYLMSILFLVGIYHSIGVKTFTFSNPVLASYMYIVYAIGILSLIYKTFLYNLFNYKHYKIKSIKKYESGNILELFLSANSAKDILNWKAGQFATFKFIQNSLKESHPFTISNAPNEKGEIRLSIKNLGDWTNKFINKIDEDRNLDLKVQIDGPFGNFISKKDKNNLEVWIAGGIGITPFLAMLEDYKKQNNLSKQIIFVWSVKDESEAVYKNEIEKDLPNNIEFILHNTTKSGYYKFINLKDKINKNCSVYICGPKSLRDSVVRDAKELNIKDINFEEFNFR